MQQQLGIIINSIVDVQCFIISDNIMYACSAWCIIEVFLTYQA